MLVLCDVPNTAKKDLDWAVAVLVDEKVEVPEGLEEIVIPANKFATAIHRGFDGLPQSWGKLCNTWVPSQGLKPAKGSRELVHFEVYLNWKDSSEGNKDEFLTQIFCPVVEE